ncbi:MAG: hypothetical protein J6W00_05375 [Lentisphaeria bacterium]|nr:hypothetical protein [Lentisphaeria bacterium]
MNKYNILLDVFRRRFCISALRLIAAAVLILYLFLFATEFVQLNFSGRQFWAAESIPRYLIHNIEHDFPESYEDWEKYPVPIQVVDLDGDSRNEFIMYTNTMIQVFSLNFQGRWEYFAGCDLVERFIYLPFRIWGFPTVLRLKRFNPTDTWLTGFKEHVRRK